MDYAPLFKDMEDRIAALTLQGDEYKAEADRLVQLAMGSYAKAKAITTSLTTLRDTLSETTALVAALEPTPSLPTTPAPTPVAADSAESPPAVEAAVAATSKEPIDDFKALGKYVPGLPEDPRWRKLMQTLVNLGRYTFTTYEATELAKADFPASHVHNKLYYWHARKGFLAGGGGQAIWTITDAGLAYAAEEPGTETPTGEHPAWRLTLKETLRHAGSKFSTSDVVRASRGHFNPKQVRMKMRRWAKNGVVETVRSGRNDLFIVTPEGVKYAHGAAS